jgi:hypothetical protein
MADIEKRWFEVTASLEIGMKVLAQDRDEAVERFWEDELEIEMLLSFPGFPLEITSVNECEPDAEGE